MSVRSRGGRAPGQRRLRPRCHLQGTVPRDSATGQCHCLTGAVSLPHRSGVTVSPEQCRCHRLPEQPPRRSRRSPGAGRGVRGGPGRGHRQGTAEPSIPPPHRGQGASAHPPALLPPAPLHPRPPGPVRTSSSRVMGSLTRLKLGSNCEKKLKINSFFFLLLRSGRLRTHSLMVVVVPVCFSFETKIPT